MDSKLTKAKHLESLRFSNYPNELIQSSVVFQEMIVDQDAISKQKPLPFSLKEESREEEEAAMLICKESDLSQSINIIPSQGSSIIDNKTSSGSIMKVLNSNTSFGETNLMHLKNINESKQIKSSQTNPFKDSRRSEEFPQDSGLQNGFNSLIHSNEKALKNIIRAHDLRIEESFGKEQIIIMNRSKELSESKLKQSGYEREPLQIIPEQRGYANEDRLDPVFTLKGKALQVNPTQNPNQNVFYPQSFKQESESQQSDSIESDKRNSFTNTSSQNNLNESDGDVISERNLQVMMHDLKNILDPNMLVESHTNSLLQQTTLDSQSKDILKAYFHRQNLKFEENKKYLLETHKNLKKEKSGIENRLNDLEAVYKHKISELEKRLLMKDERIKDLTKKTKRKDKPLNPKEKVKKTTTSKYHTEKIKNLERLLTEKNKKISSLQLILEDVRIDNQAMKELLAEVSGQRK